MALRRAVITCHWQLLPEPAWIGVDRSTRASVANHYREVKRAGAALTGGRERRYTRVLLNDQPLDTTARSALLDRLDRLYPAVVADCLDRVGVRSNVMRPEIRPLYPEARLAGFASTVHAVQVDGPPDDPEDYYKGELQAVDALSDGDVMVVSTVTGSYWGELLATASRYRGARGIVVDGYTRDTLALIDMQFPTFVAGISCHDSLGRIDVDAVGVPIDCGGVRVNQGDLLLADFDGVVVVPIEVADEVLTLAEEKVSGEDLVRSKLAEGMPVWEAFRTYGVI
jgi:4-hydroxy-4-methyl-2-oxoglutarate aldolase